MFAFLRVKNSAEQRGAQLAFKIALDAGNIRAAAEIARKHKIEYADSRMNNAYGVLRRSAMSDKEKATQLIHLMDLFRNVHGHANEVWAVHVLQMDPSQLYNLATRVEHPTVWHEYVSQLLEEKKELPHNLQWLFDHSPATVPNDERYDKLRASLILYALESGDTKTACKVAMSLYDRALVPQDSWKILIARVADVISSDRAVELAARVFPAFT